MFKDLLDKLGWDFSRFRVADIKAMVNAVFQHIRKTTQRGGDLRDSPTEVSLNESFAHPEGRTYVSISESNAGLARNLK